MRGTARIRRTGFTRCGSAPERAPRPAASAPRAAALIADSTVLMPQGQVQGGAGSCRGVQAGPGAGTRAPGRQLEAGWRGGVCSDGPSPDHRPRSTQASHAGCAGRAVSCCMRRMRQRAPHAASMRAPTRMRPRMQARCENERLLHEVERFRTRIAGATRDYVRLRLGECAGAQHSSSRWRGSGGQGGGSRSIRGGGGRTAAHQQCGMRCRPLPAPAPRPTSWSTGRSSCAGPRAARAILRRR